MTVLMNYKRTIEDFNKCGSKASTVYGRSSKSNITCIDNISPVEGLPYVAECVGRSSDR